MTTITEADVEQAALDWLARLGRGIAHGPVDVQPETEASCRRRGVRAIKTFDDALAAAAPR